MRLETETTQEALERYKKENEWHPEDICIFKFASDFTQFQIKSPQGVSPVFSDYSIRDIVGQKERLDHRIESVQESEPASLNIEPGLTG